MRPQSYPGCQGLFMRGFRFRSSLKKSDPREVFSRGLAARVFGLRPTKLLVAREKKTFGSQGTSITEITQNFR